MSILKNRWVLLALLMLTGGLAWAAIEPDAATAADNYLNGGIGLDARAAMHAERAHYNLRLAFAEAHSGEYLAGLHLTITPLGNQDEAQRYDDCGPLFYAQLKPGRYRISAEYEGKTQELSTTVGAKGVDRVLYWR